MYILWIFLFCRWVTDFKNKLVSGEVPSLTKAKDIATVQWRNYSTQYDSKRAVQQPTANPGTGHRVKRSRQDDDTQCQYRKRKAEQERLQSPEKTQQPDARVEKALCVTSVIKKIMKLTKEDLKTERQKTLTGQTIETSTNGYKDHQIYETVIVSSGNVWTIIIQINFIKQFKM
jgi:hypothetical protein